MNIAVTGALVGLAIGLLIFIGDFMVMRSNLKEREERLKRRIGFNPTEKRRMSSLAFFCLVVMPPAFAYGFWAMMG